MGNSFSAKNKQVHEIIDYIACDYILTMDYASLRKLLRKKYCDQLVVITSKILDKYLTDIDVEHLKSKLQNTTRDTIRDVTAIRDTNRLRVCAGLAKFYIKIAHVFAVIIMTINPVYSYPDGDGNAIKVPFYKKHAIPFKSLPHAKLEHKGLCQNRMNSSNANASSGSGSGSGSSLFENMFNNAQSSSSSPKKTLKSNEPCVPELMQLYYDDLFDYTTGTFYGMTKQTASEYSEDLQHFYASFVCKNNLPNHVRKFSDIKLKDCDERNRCGETNDATYANTHDNDNENNENHENHENNENHRKHLFEKYAENIKIMIEHTNANQDELLNIIDALFEQDDNGDNSADKIRIRSNLTDSTLQDLVTKTRSSIIKLYLTCETDYANNIKIYEAIVELLIVNTAQKRINNLELSAKTLCAPSNLKAQGSRHGAER